MLPSWVSSWCYQQMLHYTGKWLPGTNTLAYLASSFATEGKKFYNIDTWCQHHKTFFFLVTIEEVRWASGFSPGKPFQFCLIFASKVGSFSKAHPSRAGSWPYPQTLGLDGEAWQWQTLPPLLDLFVGWIEKSFVTLTPGRSGLSECRTCPEPARRTAGKRRASVRPADYFATRWEDWRVSRCSRTASFRRFSPPRTFWRRRYKTFFFSVADFSRKIS